MNYIKIYNSLTYNKCHRNKNEGVYYEKHHIIPKCMGGSNEESNLVLLTFREHFLAHWILSRIYPENFKIICAWNSFCMGNNGYRPSSRLYEYARLKFIIALSKNEERKRKNSLTVKDQRWINNGVTCTRIHKDEVEKFLSKGWVKGRIKYKRKSPSIETRQKMSEAASGKSGSNESKIKKSESSKNRIWINNGKRSMFIKKESLGFLLSDGWALGRIMVWKKRKVFNSKMKGVIK